MIKSRKISLIISIIIFSYIFASCLTDDPLKKPFQNYTPPNIDDGWVIGNPAEVGIDGEALKDIYRYVHNDDGIWQIRSLLIFKDGYLVAESYMKDNSDRTTPRAVWSCTKQFIGILIGIAVDEGKISLIDTIADHLPQQASRYPDKSGITIENLLMMKSGIKYENDGNDSDDAKFAREEFSSSLNFIFGLKMHAAPGEKYKYKNSDPHILSAILQEIYKKPMRDWAQEVLFAPIGITRLSWLNYKDGITMGGYGIKTTPRELGKIGELMLNDGMWNGKQIVSSTWIDEMTTAKIPPSEMGGYGSGIAFGYQWWKDEQRNLNIMWGYGGQLVFINKDKNLIVVITGETRLSGDFNLSINDALKIYDRINVITQ